MFGGLNLADLGQHAEQLKALVAAQLTATQENSANSLGAKQAAESLGENFNFVLGAVKTFEARIEKVESGLAEILAFVRALSESPAEVPEEFTEGGTDSGESEEVAEKTE